MERRGIDWTSVLVAMIVPVALGLMGYGAMSNRVDSGEKRIERMETSGSAYAQQTRQMVETDRVAINELKADVRAQGKDIGDMKSDLKLLVRDMGQVAEWVKEQKRGKVGE